MTGPRRVLVSGARAPVALAIGRAFALADYEVHFVDSVPSLMIALSSFGADRLHRVPPPRGDFPGFRAAIARLIAALEPCLIVPTCEEVFYLAQAAALDSFADRLFAPPLALLRRLHSKAEFVDLAAACGLHPPPSWPVTSRAELARFASRSRDFVFKPIFSRFAAETLVRPPATALDRLRPTPDRAWLAQQFVAGEEVSVWSAARGGKLVAAAAYRPKWHFAGASAYFERDDDPALVDACARLAAATALTGQLSLDCIRTPGGTLHPIECNPRAVSGVELLATDPRLGPALAGVEGPMLAPTLPACHVSAAFWPAAALHLLKGGAWAEVTHDARRSIDVVAGPGQRAVLLGAGLDVARFALAGLVASRSAVRQSTADIEWNGELIG